MSASIKHLTQLEAWLAMEREAAWNDYREKIEKTELTERVENGVTWYPVAAVESGYGLGDYPFLVMERTRNHGTPHQFQAGKVVRLFSEDLSGQMQTVAASVHWVDKNRMKLILQQDELPENYDTGKWGIDLMFDSTSFREMEFALKAFQKAEHDRTRELRELLYGDRTVHFTDTPTPALPGLNDSQNEAVATAIAAEDLAVIHGPPGTGKTTTLIGLLQTIARTEQQILVCAPSNAATDLLVTRAANAGLSVVRIGNLSRVDESIVANTLEARLTNHPQYKELKRSKRKAEEYRSMALKYKRKFGKAEREQRKFLLQEAKAIAQEARQMEDYLLQQVLDQGQLVCCTLVGAASRYLRKRAFDTLVIDEAGQALEPATLIPILKARKVILAGDPLQLPPTLLSAEAQRQGFNQTLLERLQKRLPKVSLLNTQYRMEAAIMEFSNLQFYKGALKAAEAIEDRQIPAALAPAITYVDTAGCGFDEKQHPESRSLYNAGEAGILLRQLEALDAGLTSQGTFTVGVISPYREQVKHLQGEIPMEGWNNLTLTINTIDSFQGQERDLVFISLVRSNEKSEIGFLSDYRRMNVAMTRARLKLVMIGDSATLGAHGFYQQLVEYCESKDAYRSAWEWM
ncbi:MAG: AAA domain-containing protein [Salibacteraceae bacterium]